MLTAITRKPSAALARCALQYLSRQEIDPLLAARQQAQYESCLTELGAHLISLPPEPDLPDAVFVEDPVVVVDQVAVMGRMASDSRRPESASVARALAAFRPLRSIREPATLEGGDVLRAGSILFAGLSTRTNPAGVAQLDSELAPHGYTVRPVEVRHCLHLKTACSHLGDRTILANRNWIDTAPFHGFDILDVPPNEPWSANVLRIGDTILVPSSFPGAARLLERAGYVVRTLDISELMKAEAGLTCLSVLFESGV